MRKRSTEILLKLLRNPSKELSMQKLTEGYHLSERTLRKDIQEVREFIRENGLESILICDNQGIKLNGTCNVRELIDQVYSMDSYQYKMSVEERKIYIIIVLLYHQGYYSMQQIADELYVTRNTVIYDCKNVEKYLQKYEIDFIAKSKKGICLGQGEEKKRKMIVDIFQEMIPSLQQEKDFFVRFIVKKSGFIYSLKDIVYHMNCFANDNSMAFTKDIFFRIAVCVFVLINHLQNTGYYKSENKQEISSHELDIIGKMINYVAEEVGFFALEYDGIQIIEQQILSRSLNSQLERISDFELYGVICHFLLEIGREMKIDIQSDTLLIESLIAHIKGMDNWNDEDYEWDTWYETSEDFPRVRKITEGKFCILETYLGYNMSRRMKDSIIIHICVSILRVRKNNKPLAVIISCPGSMATSRYLEVQIKNYFNFEVVGNLTTRQVEESKENLEHVDFIISTVPVKKSIIPVVVVSPLLTTEDIDKIRYQAFIQDNAKFSDAMVRFPVLAKIHAIYESGNSQKIHYLEEQFQQILDNSIYNRKNNFKLTSMLKYEYIKISDQKLKWREAIKLSSQDLLRDGYISKRYVQEAIENVEMYGSYIIVNKGIALAHARKEAGVYKDGISLLTARKGIVFENGDIVYLMFFFAQKGEGDYLDLMKEIIKIGNNQENISKIGEISDNKKIHEFIREILSID